MPEPNSGCLLWLGILNEDGYGYFRWTSAHRYALERRLGRPLAVGEQALHRCDTPCCVNADHLFIGNPAINMADKMAKGRHNPPVGERARSARLTSAQIREIRALASSLSTVEIGRRYGITFGHARHIIVRRKWGHLPD